MLRENPNKLYLNFSNTPDPSTIGFIDKHNPNFEMIVDDISRILIKSEIEKSFQSFWDRKFNDKYFQERKNVHKQLIQSYVLKQYMYEIDKIGKLFSKNTFDCKDGIYPLNELTQNVSKYFNPIFFDRALGTKIKTTQPVEGPGENFLWTIFSNLDFAQGKGDLVDTLNNYKIEVKADSGSLGSNTSGRDWSATTSKALCEILSPYISEPERNYLMDASCFGPKTASCIETAMKCDLPDSVIEKICLTVSNYNDVPQYDIKSFIDLIKQKKDQKSITKLVIAMHMKLYATDENFDKLFIFNGDAERNINKLVVMTAKQDMHLLLDEIEKYNICQKGWGAGKKGIRIIANV